MTMPLKSCSLNLRGINWLIDRLNLEEEGLGAVKYVLGKGAFGKVVLGKCKGKKVAIKAVTKDGGISTSKRVANQ